MREDHLICRAYGGHMIALDATLEYLQGKYGRYWQLRIEEGCILMTYNRNDKDEFWSSVNIGTAGRAYYDGVCHAMDHDEERILDDAMKQMALDLIEEENNYVES